MNDDDFAEFFRNKGRRVVKTASGYWYEPHSFCFQNIPYHQAINPNKRELRDLFFKHRAMLVRFNSIANENTFPGYVWICDQKNYDLANLGTKTRNQTRRGLEQSQVRAIDFDLLMQKGWEFINDTAQRQGREADFAAPEAWGRYCKAAAGNPDFEAWGAFIQEQLVSFLVGGTIDDYYWILRQYSETAYLKHYPNNALIYTVTKLKLGEPTINKVSYGLDSVESTRGLNKFKQGMGFSRQEYHQKILINPMFKWIKSKFIKLLVRHISNILPKSNYLKKADAIINLIIE
jgi:hypothetical protein